ncbi:MAG: hypothetical protein GY749_46055 [Desulfobacteraceae bacterium]|nr:hypothetical protein [Desulfobacteraceae bacterium]
MDRKSDYKELENKSRELEQELCEQKDLNTALQKQTRAPLFKFIPPSLGLDC